MCTKARQAGLTLIELIVFIVIVGVALAGSLTVLNITAKASADPMIRKQALAIAEATLEEVMLQPFTWCDPNDTNASTATSYAGCSAAAAAQNLASAKSGESRSSTTSPLDNVFDYNGVLPINGNIAGTGNSTKYGANVTVAPTTLGPTGALVGDGSATSAALLVTVTVNAGNETIQLQGYRTRYAPNSLP